MRRGGVRSWRSIMQQTSQGRHIATWTTSAPIGAHGATQVIKIVDEQMHAHKHSQFRTKCLHAQGVNGLTLETSH